MLSCLASITDITDQRSQELFLTLRVEEIFPRVCFKFMSQHWRDLTVGVTITGDDMGLSDQDYDAILNFYI